MKRFIAASRAAWQEDVARRGGGGVGHVKVAADTVRLAAKTLISRDTAAAAGEGPVRYRLERLVLLAGLLATAALVILALNSLLTPYRGASYPGFTGRYGTGDVQVRVESCVRVGPLHDWELGYWWACRVQVPEGGHAELGGSIVTNDQIGQTVELHRHCRGPYGKRCSLGKDTAGLETLYSVSLGLIRLMTYLFVGIGTFRLLLAAGLGRRKFERSWLQPEDNR
jgi:hypothetical protein